MGNAGAVWCILDLAMHQFWSHVMAYIVYIDDYFETNGKDHREKWSWVRENTWNLKMKYGWSPWDVRMYDFIYNICMSAINTWVDIYFHRDQ